ncbi:hypothetical protein M404DRAFT_20099 [Pisolithus tinctorius Marx 270]|uniref:Uncharacterized protein n=1 Tax=Pisolithus tinctorius Marx 270 TaxID=870435 RepID=A0A0C3PSW9_PISTI|nr:hypothetical protein M404DRAFT_20099 [Pisolithus tinctorius Marx 270]
MLRLTFKSPFAIATSISTLVLRTPAAPALVPYVAQRHLHHCAPLSRHSLSHAPGNFSSSSTTLSNLSPSSSSRPSDRFRPDTEPSPHPNAEDYCKDDVVTSPPSSSVYAVDPSCENVQSAQDAPTSGQWSQASAHAGEWSRSPDSARMSRENQKSRWEDQYENVSRDEPYDVPTPSNETRSLRDGSKGEERKLRYGGQEARAKEKGHEVSPPQEGPSGTEKGGRKPEGI